VTQESFVKIYWQSSYQPYFTMANMVNRYNLSCHHSSPYQIKSGQWLQKHLHVNMEDTL